MPLVSLTVTLHGTIVQEMTDEQWRELDERLEADGMIKIGDGVDIDWMDAINQLDGDIEDAEVAKPKKKSA